MGCYKGSMASTLQTGLFQFQLTAAKVFTAMALFGMLTGPLNAFPFVVNGMVEAAVSIRRISQFLTLPAMIRQDYFDAKILNEGVDVEVKGARFSHSRHQGTLQFELKGISLTVKQGEVRVHSQMTSRMERRG